MFSDLQQIIITLNKLAVYKINLKITSNPPRYNHTRAEKKVWKSIPFIITANNIKYHWVTLNKKAKNLYDNNFNF